MRQYILTIFMVTALLIPAPSFGNETDSMALKSSYLESIHEDCRLFLENIELFIRRDYPKFWENMANGNTLPPEDVKKYISEQKHFEKLLDALFKEFISFKSETPEINTESGPAKELLQLETEIYQMLAYAYIKTCDFSMGRALLAHSDISGSNVTVSLLDIEGKSTPFELTDALKKLSAMMETNLSILNISLKYFSPSEIQQVDAYLTISDFDADNPFNQVFMTYFASMFPGLKTQGENRIHFNEIMHYFNRLDFDALNKDTQSPSDGKTASVYAFPSLKGTYEIKSNDPAILVESSGQQMTVEHLCYFKGFERTDFRKLKGAEIKQVQEKTIIDKGLSMEPASENGILSGSTLKLMDGFEPVKPGQQMRYGIYRLYENNAYIGAIELVPCFKGNDCKKQTAHKSITAVKIFDHELVFFQDILDLIKRNNITYAQELKAPKSLSSNNKEKSSTRKSSSQLPPDEIHIGRGCSR